MPQRPRSRASLAPSSAATLPDRSQQATATPPPARTRAKAAFAAASGESRCDDVDDAAPGAFDGDGDGEVGTASNDVDNAGAAGRRRLPDGSAGGDDDDARSDSSCPLAAPSPPPRRPAEAGAALDDEPAAAVAPVPKSRTMHVHVKPGETQDRAVAEMVGRGLVTNASLAIRFLQAKMQHRYCLPIRHWAIGEILSLWEPLFPAARRPPSSQLRA